MNETPDTSSEEWTSECPTEPGEYEIICDSRRGRALTKISVKQIDGELKAICLVGKYAPVKEWWARLRNPQWRPHNHVERPEDDCPTCDYKKERDDWQARALAAEEELGKASNRIKELAEAGQVSMDHALTNGITAGNCHIELSACKEALRVARVAKPIDETLRFSKTVDDSSLWEFINHQSVCVEFHDDGSTTLIYSDPTDEAPDRVCIVSSEATVKPPPPAPFSVQAGKRYRRRDGAISGVVELHDGSDSHPFREASEGWLFTNDGHLFTAGDHEYDLVAEYLEGES